MKVIPKPKKKDYCRQTWATEFINANKGKNEPKITSLDKKGYIEHLEKYCEYLEKLIVELENK